MSHFLIAIIFVCSACSGMLDKRYSSMKNTTMHSNKILIVYLSRTNNTKTVAEIIQEKTGGTLLALELVTPYPEDYKQIVEQVVHENESGYLPPLKNVIVLIGAGSIGKAIARRVSIGKHLLLADKNQQNIDAVSKTLEDAGFNVSTAFVDVSSRESVKELMEKATSLGDITGMIHAAGVSPSQASSETILKVDLCGTALVLEEFGNVIIAGGSCVVIASQSGHRLPALSIEQNKALAITPVEELLNLPFLQPDKIKDSLHAYQLSKRGNSLRVMAEDVRWGRRGARVNTISPGIIMTPLANDELKGPRGEGYRRMIDLSSARRAGTPDEVGNVAALLMGPDGEFITGSDFLMDGGVTAAYWFGDLALK